MLSRIAAAVLAAGCLLSGSFARCDDETSEDVFAEKPADTATSKSAATMSRWLEDRLQQPIQQANIDIRPTTVDTEGKPLPTRPKIQLPSQELSGEPREAWGRVGFGWASRTDCHHPLYFEQRCMERCGCQPWGCWQPVASAIHFTASAVLLPAKLLVHPPAMCVYENPGCPCRPIGCCTKASCCLPPPEDFTAPVMAPPTR